jgi:hypothetical protein
MYRFFRAGMLALLVGAPVVAAAQAGMTPHFNIAAGASFPTSDFSDANSTGYNLIAGIGITPSGFPLGIRVEGLYNQFDYKSDFNPSTDKSRVSAITGNLTYNILQPNTTQTNTFYVIGGLGYYDTRNRLQFDSQDNIGYNIGAGFKFPLAGFSAYIEARYHTVSNVDISFVPISFGLVF